MGEPLANYQRVLAPAIRRLADEGLQVRLAVSLHTPDDELRDTLVPVNNRWPVDEVLKAAGYYLERTGRRVSGCGSTSGIWCTSTSSR